ncbi:MAG: proteasome accessory factor PafA2 family protein, partial [Actinomycetota bacterium]
VYLFKNNTDSAGNSYGCHENYLTGRDGDARHESVLIPFLVARQLICGAGRTVSTSRGPVFCLSQRAEHIWEGVSSATTRSRPIINTLDEPHADGDVYRRLHVIVGDSNMAPDSNVLKLGTAAIVLRMVESDDLRLRDLTLESPIRAIREISMDITGRRPVRLANGREMSALDILSELAEAALAFRSERGLPDEESDLLDLWVRTLDDVAAGPERVERRHDWANKRRLVHAYAEPHGDDIDSPQVQALELQYHDIDENRGVFHRVAASGAVDSSTVGGDVDTAVTDAPPRTRAHLRGRFIKAAKEKGRDYTVDWVHLKVNDQAQRTVACKDPFRNVDERVDKLIATL